jgi:hypothetical protein
MDPTLSGFALGLLLGAAKVGFIGTVVFGVAWWRTRTKLRRMEATLPDPAQLAERLANLEQLVDYTAGQMDRLVMTQEDLTRQLLGRPANPSPPERQ